MTTSDVLILYVEPILLDGYIKRYRVWCKYCEDWHYHGPAEGLPTNVIVRATLSHPTMQRTTS
ncbi:MAG: hypothetical protein Aurels2KO_55860 [Aureliella sp.]